MPRTSYSHFDSHDSAAVYWVLLVGIIISITLMATQGRDARLRQAVQSQSDEIVSPLTSLVSQPIRATENFFYSLADRQRAFEENKALRIELQELREKIAGYAVIETKMQRYEQILGSKNRTEIPLRKLVARAVNDLKGPFVRALLLNVGQKDGVEIGQAVMAPEGLVGHVILVGSDSSRVLRLDDLNSRIPVMSERSQAVAVLAGDNTDFPKLLFIDVGMDWQVGDLILTSGDDGRLPRGLVVGNVVEASDGELKAELSGLNKPLDWVWVALFSPIETPVAVESPTVELDNDEVLAPERRRIEDAEPSETAQSQSSATSTPEEAN
ncbi:rod shape-determining protein MreC [Litorimonas sp.]|uniref:rod shape-determining protein MreC n=1 Tax=Litorimonas sp. TaxID=1892381 RepID=UPI003A84B77D